MLPELDQRTERHRGRKRVERSDPRHDRRRVTHCPKGHEYTTENSYIDPNSGARKCRACQHEGSKRRFRHHLYGLTLEQYEFLLREQRGRCAICGTERNGEVALAVDHDHSTGRVRGILCDPCNIGIGGFHDDSALLRAAITYLQRPPPQIPQLMVELDHKCGLCGADAGVRPRRPLVKGRTTIVCDSCWHDVQATRRARRAAGRR